LSKQELWVLVSYLQIWNGRHLCKVKGLMVFNTSEISNST
jgi:hypothetical protein